MTDVFTTVLSGVFVYIVGQWVLRWVIEPVQDTRKTIGEIAHFLREYQAPIANRDVTSKERLSEISNRLNLLSADLFSHLYLVPGYNFTRRLFGLPSSKHIRDVERELRGLSNAVVNANSRLDEEIARRHDKIFDGLGIQFPDSER